MLGKSSCGGCINRILGGSRLSELFDRLRCLGLNWGFIYLRLSCFLTSVVVYSKLLGYVSLCRCDLDLGLGLDLATVLTRLFLLLGLSPPDVSLSPSLLFVVLLDALGHEVFQVMGSFRRELVQFKFNHIVLAIALERVLYNIKDAVLLLLVQFTNV